MPAVLKEWSERQDLNLRRLGPKPSIGVVSSLLIVTFGCSIIPIHILTSTNVCKHYLHLMSNFVQAKLCRAVSRFDAVSEVCQKRIRGCSVSGCVRGLENKQAGEGVRDNVAPQQF